jgi:hypothetical protein
VSLDFLDGKEHLISRRKSTNQTTHFAAHHERLRRDWSEKFLNCGELEIQVVFKDPGSLQQGVHFKKIIRDRRKQPLLQEHRLAERTAGGIILQTDSSPMSSGRLHGDNEKDILAEFIEEISSAHGARRLLPATNAQMHGWMPGCRVNEAFSPKRLIRLAQLDLKNWP